MNARAWLVCGLLPLVIAAHSVRGQTPSGNDAATARSFISSTDITQQIAKAAAAAKKGEHYDAGPLLQQSRFKLVLDYRTNPVDVTYNIHETEAELFIVQEGSGDLLLGGTLVEPTRTGSNLSAKHVDGGESRKISKGDLVLVPENTVHAITHVDGHLVLLAMHLPQPAALTTH